MSEQFETNDVVRMKSGGLAMRVLRIDTKAEKLVVVCMRWHGTKYDIVNIDPDLLEPVTYSECPTPEPSIVTM